MAEEKKIDYKRKDTSSTSVEIELVIPAKEYKARYKKDLEEVARNVKVKGFRPGKAPVSVVEESHGSEAQKSAFEAVIGEYAGEVLKREKLAPAASPTIDVKEMSSGGDISLVMKVPVIPKISIPNFSSFTVKKESISVSDTEVEEVLKRLWQEHRGKFKNKTNQWVAQIAPKLGFASKNLQSLKKEIREAVEREKERIASESYTRSVLLEAIQKAGVEVPDELISAETAERERSFATTLNQMKTTEDEFCSSRGVTMDQLREQWEKDAREAIETDIFLSAFAVERSVFVSKEELEKEVDVLRAQSKDPNGDVFDNQEWRRYIERVMLKRKAYQAFLSEVQEARKKKKTSKS